MSTQIYTLTSAVTHFTCNITLITLTWWTGDDTLHRRYYIDYFNLEKEGKSSTLGRQLNLIQEVMIAAQ